jgi:nitrite reductase/ring-hydroxylating ferredoxin subunit
LPDEANAARPAAGTVLCAVEDIAEPGGKTFRFREGDDLFTGVVVRYGGEVVGYVDSCPHFGWPLAQHDAYLFSGQHLLCSGHGAMFRPLDGVCVAGPCLNEALATWPVAVRDGQVVCA